MTPVPGPATVAIIGTGLIGTSIALALREKGSTVWLADQDPAAARLAADLGAGDPLPAPGHGATADVAVIAVPPDAVADTLAAAQERGLARYYTDVASVKQLPVAQARDRGCDLVSYVPGHPLAGREKHGPAAARADLFLGPVLGAVPDPGDFRRGDEHGHVPGPRLRCGAGADRRGRARPVGGARLARAAPGGRGHGRAPGGSPHRGA